MFVGNSIKTSFYNKRYYYIQYIKFFVNWFTIKRLINPELYYVYVDCLEIWNLKSDSKKIARKRKHQINVEIPELPTHDSKHTKLFVIGSNKCGELSLGDSVEEVKYPRNVESSVDFHIVKISCRSLHIAALTWDRKVKN